jgi:hypothetical protein
MLDYNYYVWRGERLSNRPLLPTFDRANIDKNQKEIEEESLIHLETFKYSTRGRRGSNPSKLETENEWWAIGQHYGLNTPLLDWTRSPFVALFFAFEKENKDSHQNRIIYAVNPSSCEDISEEIKAKHTGKDRPDIVEFFTPLQDENYRLVNQNGLFSRCTLGKALDKWISEKKSGYTGGGIMLKILIPNKGREECLRTLNKMNINHLTLFPDLYGASNFSNFTNSIKKY